jgi:Ca2+-binding RTX toxin-like protein
MPRFEGTDAGDTLAGGAEDDFVIGLGGADSLAGLGGSDELHGGAGNDTLDGGIGSDTLVDTEGSDRLIGGPGFDFISTTRSPFTNGTSLYIDGGDDNDILSVRISNVSATATVLGGAGNDQIQLYGSIGSAIDAGAGDDLVIMGDSFSSPGAQAMTVTLGLGADRLRYDFGRPATITVTDFQTGDGGDRVEIPVALRISGWDGATNPFTTGHFRLEQRGADAVLLRDADGPGSQAAYADLIVFRNTSAASFTAFNLFDYAPTGVAPASSTITGTDTHDDLPGTVGGDSIVGRAGSDYITGRGGADTLDGGADDDGVFGGAGGDSLVGGSGNDDLQGDDDDATAGADTIVGGEGNDFIGGGAANDLLFGDAGVDWMVGGKGDDLLRGGADADRLEGSEGADILEGGDGDDWLDGEVGIDTLSGGAGADTFTVIGFHTSFTQADLDVVTDWSSADKLRFRTNVGSDIGGAYVEITAADLSAALTQANSLIAARTALFVAVQIGPDVMVFANAAQYGGQVTEGFLLKGRTLADISEANVHGAVAAPSPNAPPAGTTGNDNAALGDGADTYAAGAGADTVTGGAGDDRIAGDAGDDRVFAGPGADTITDSEGSNYLRGDEGDDLITGGTGFDDINGNMGNDTASGGLGEDWVVGGKDNDSLSGGAAYDLVYGNLGNDTCEGGDGNDIIRGGQENDVVRGGAGDDYVSGDRGDDTMTGDAGADIFHSFGEAGIDRVTDFSLAQGDRVQLDPGTQYTLAQVGADTVVSMTGGGQVILVGVSMASLTPGWIFGA